MSAKTIALCASLVLGVSIASGSVVAQGMMGNGMMQGGNQGTGAGMMPDDSTKRMQRPNMTQGGMTGMMCPMMSGMMGSMMNGMMQGDQTMMKGGSGMAALFGSRVVPKMNLSVDDVRSYLTARLDHLGNKRLKLGNVKINNGAITADIVTADNSLVERMSVDRSTGKIQYQD